MYIYNSYSYITTHYIHDGHIETLAMYESLATATFKQQKLNVRYRDFFPSLYGQHIEKSYLCVKQYM